MIFRVGDIVQIRTKDEILNTLDETGKLDGLPFMPQMFGLCGQTFRVFKSAHKTCDTVNQTGGRLISDCVHLDIRCDGGAYGGCQAQCLIFWKTAWLRVADSPLSAVSSQEQLSFRCTEDVVLANTSTVDSETGKRKYSCQATELPNFTSALAWWDIRQYIADYRTGNASFGELLKCGLFAAYCWIMNLGIGVGRPMRWLYNMIQNIRHSTVFPLQTGIIEIGEPTPNASLSLRRGDRVRVKQYSEILLTLDKGNKNRGLFFDSEQVPYCGKEYDVHSTLNTFINEKTGFLVETKTPAIILDKVWCKGRYSTCRKACPRSIYSWWREVWLERIESKPDRDAS